MYDQHGALGQAHGGSGQATDQSFEDGDTFDATHPLNIAAQVEIDIKSEVMRRKPVARQTSILSMFSRTHT